MIFSQKPVIASLMIEALTEASYLFSHRGEFLSANKAGRDMLRVLGFRPNKNPERCESLTEILRAHGKDLGDSCIELQGHFYEIAIGRFDEGQLLRLMPIADDRHIQRLYKSIDMMPWALLTIDLSGDDPRVVFSNQKASVFLNQSRESMHGCSPSEVFRLFGIESHLAEMMQADTVTQYDYEFKSDGPTAWYRAHVIPYRCETRYCLIVIEDTTESKVMEGQYLQSQRLESLGQLAGGVAHDFNNILSIIDGYAHIARKSVQGNTDALNYLDRISQSVQRGSALTGQLLTFGSHKVVKDAVTDFGALVRDQESLIRPLIDASIVMSIKAGDNIFVQVAPDNICQIMLNLCINSRDAMPDGGNLMIEALKDDDCAILRVIDTGCGMTPEIKAKIFDPFFTTKDQGKGTGLGLSMVYGLVKDMHGSIDVISKAGSGTAFTIRVPLSTARPSVKDIVEEQDGKIHLNGFTALVAEDEPDLLNLLSNMLEEMGVKVLRASNGNQALLIQESYDGDIDFLLTDVVMPELNGVRLAELFETVRPASKIMFMSGYPANGLMARVPLPEGAFLMAKPVDFKKLGALLKSMVRDGTDTTDERWKEMSTQWKSA